ncbi:MAG: SpoIIE family protein phosphatase [Candidatus Ozemobacteraceae bacterium]
MPDWNAWATRIKWILVCLVFFALPFILTTYGLGTIWDAQEEASLERAYQSLDATLISIRRSEGTDKYLEMLLTRFGLRLDKAKPLQLASDRFRGVRAFKARFSELLHFTFVDSEGNLIPSLTDGDPSKAMIKRLHAVTRACALDRPEKDNLLSTYFSLIKNFVGQVSSKEQILRGHRTIFEVGIEDNDRYFYYSVGSWGAFYVHIARPYDWSTLPIRDTTRRAALVLKKRGVEIGLEDASRLSPDLPTDLSFALAEFGKSSRPHFTVGERIFSVMGTGGTWRLWAARSRSSALDLRVRRVLYTLAGTMLFGFLAFLSQGVMVCGRQFTFSIRRRLIILFAFAGGLPLAVVVLSGWDYLNEKFVAKVRAAHDQSERSLLAFDTRFPQIRGMMEVNLRRIVSSCRYEIPRQQTRTQHLLKYLAIRYSAADMILLDKQGKTVWDKDEFVVKAKTQQNRKILGAMIKNIVGMLNREESDGKPDAASMIMESVGGMDSPIVQLARSLTSIFDFNVAGNRNWTFFYPLRNKEKVVSHMVGTLWNANGLEQHYLKTYLLAAQRDMPDTKLLAVNLKRRVNVPSTYPVSQRLLKFIQELGQRQNLTIGSMKMGQRNYLLTGVKPKELSENLLIAIYDDTAIRSEINKMRERLWGFTALSAAISIFLGFLLSNRFLTPIGQLSDGVQAIQDRKFTHRVPTGESDELGQLALTFNNVMEGLSELEVGRIVQESLFPDAGVITGEYLIHGVTSFASELGGDYYDLQSLPDGRVLILIGDVSGHGVPAALVMAMAKAIVERECEVGNTRPEDILGSIHRVMFKTLKRKRMMTCFLALLDPKTNQLHVANAGHNYPYLFRGNEPPAVLSKSSFPLGSRKTLTLVPATVNMMPDDWVLFYTDGLVEATVAENPLGYDSMLAGVRQRLSGSPKNVCEEVFKWHRGLTGTGPQEDDITVVFLHRAPSARTDSSKAMADGSPILQASPVSTSSI